MQTNSVSIIGSGPAGLQTAIKLKDEGFEPIVYEEHDSVGVPEHCTGLISRTGIEELEIELESILQNKIYGAKLFSPDGTMLKIERKEPVAYVVNRTELDKSLLRKARIKGVHVSTNTKLIDARKSLDKKDITLFMQVDGRGEMRKTQFVVGADGVNSTVRHLIGINPKKESFVHSIQATVKSEYNERLVEVHLGDYAKGFFAWVVPIDKTHAKVGLGTNLGENISENFKEFLKHRFGDEKIHTSDKISALIPYGDPLTGIVKENYALVGDAAFQTKATTGGGIIFGMKAGNLLGETIAKSLTKTGNLKDYEKKLNSINKELKLHWKIRRYANSLKNEEIDALFKKLKEKGIEKFLEEHGHMDEPSKFVGKLLSNPTYWSLAGPALKFFRS